MAHMFPYVFQKTYFRCHLRHPCQVYVADVTFNSYIFLKLCLRMILDVLMFDPGLAAFSNLFCFHTNGETAVSPSSDTLSIFQMCQNSLPTKKKCIHI